jgi:hypothetical protein
MVDSRLDRMEQPKLRSLRVPYKQYRSAAQSLMEKARTPHMRSMFGSSITRREPGMLRRHPAVKGQ